jgi:arginine repressor
MAKAEKPEISKKQALAEYLTANPGSSTQDVIQALKQQGFDVSEASVYNAKWLLKKGQEPAAKKAPAKRAAKAAKSASTKSASTKSTPTEVAPAELAPAELAPAAPEPAAAPSNKTQAVKDYLARNRHALTKEIVAALKAEGIDVSPNYVSGIKAKLGSKKDKRRPASPPASAQAPAAKPVPAVAKDAISMVWLQQAKKLAVELGGIREAKAAIEALAQLID